MGKLRGFWGFFLKKIIENCKKFPKIGEGFGGFGEKPQNPPKIPKNKVVNTNVPKIHLIYNII